MIQVHPLDELLAFCSKVVLKELLIKGDSWFHVDFQSFYLYL